MAFHIWRVNQRQLLPGKFVAFIAILSGLTAAARAGEISVTITGAIPDGTYIYVTLCSGGLEPAFCSRGGRKPAEAPTEHFMFGDVAAGRYAVLAFQDVNRSGTLERSSLGIPLEPFAFSNDAGTHKKPTFEAAAVTIGDAKVEVSLVLHSLVRGTAPQ